MMTMKRSIVAVLISVAMLAGCASLPPRQQAAVGLQAVLTTVDTARNIERAVCQPSADLNSVVVACTEEAHQLGLTDAKHQQLARLFAQAFRQIAFSAKEFQDWSVPEARPSLDQILSTLHLVKVELVSLVPNEPKAQQIVALLDKAITQLEKVRGVK